MKPVIALAIVLAALGALLAAAELPEIRRYLRIRSM
jgi:hypothetical protein